MSALPKLITPPLVVVLMVTVPAEPESTLERVLTSRVSALRWMLRPDATVCNDPVLAPLVVTTRARRVLLLVLPVTVMSHVLALTAC